MIQLLCGLFSLFQGIPENEKHVVFNVLHPLLCLLSLTLVRSVLTFVPMGFFISPIYAAFFSYFLILFQSNHSCTAFFCNSISLLFVSLSLLNILFIKSFKSSLRSINMHLLIFLLSPQTIRPFVF